MEYEFELEFGERMFRIYITANIEIGNDSIGHYEFWGQSCYDNQPDYASMIDYEIDSVIEILDDGGEIEITDWSFIKSEIDVRVEELREEIESEYLSKNENDYEDS